MLKVQTIIDKDIKTVWDRWITPEHIVNWNFATDHWECPFAINNFKEGGIFKYTMSAKDKSFEFDFSGTYTEIVDFKKIEYVLNDNRLVSVEFLEDNSKTMVIENFDEDKENPNEIQVQGWSLILENFKIYCEMS